MDDINVKEKNRVIPIKMMHFSPCKEIDNNNSDVDQYTVTANKKIEKILKLRSLNVRFNLYI